MNLAILITTLINNVLTISLDDLSPSFSREKNFTFEQALVFRNEELEQLLFNKFDRNQKFYNSNGFEGRKQ